MSYMRVSTEGVTALCSEIRNKTGLTDGLTTEQAIIDIAASPTLARDIPNYVRDEAVRVANIVKGLQNENTVSFICVTDLHAQPTDTATKQKFADGIKHCAQAVQLVRGLVPIDFTASLGDFVYGSVGESAQTHRDNLMRSMRVLSMISPDFWLQGNHDAHYHVAESYMTRDDLYRYCTRFNSAKAVTPTTDANRGYFHADLTDKKLRVICLNTSDLDPETIPTSANKDGHYVSATQLRWLVSVLDMTGKDDWGIVILSHHPIHWGQRYPTVSSPMNIVLEMLEAYVSGTSGSAVTQVEGETITYDFAGKNAARLIGCIHGHTHNLIHDHQGEQRIVRMGTPNACQDRTNEYGTSAGYDATHKALFGETTTYPKSPNSATDTAFVVYTIDTQQEIIYATCYGAGYDRMLEYGDLNYFSVTLDLTDVSSSNTALSAAENMSYATTLTPTDGYDLYSVTITMGGVDVTASVYTNGTITIPTVTGDIVITAKAKWTPSVEYTNLITTSKDVDDSVYGTDGYMDGYQLSEGSENSSNGYATKASGFFTTGWIELAGNRTFYIYGVEPITYGTANGGTKTRVVLGSSYTSATYFLYNIDGFSSYFSITDVGNGVYKLEFTEHGAKNNKYFRLSTTGSGDGVVITTTDLTAIINEVTTLEEPMDDITE